MMALGNGAISKAAEKRLMHRTRHLRAVSALAFALGAAVLTGREARACEAEPMLGSVCMTAANFCPRGFAQANGQLLAINQNQALFSLLGTTYGGNGQTTFALPDLRGRVPISSGRGTGLPAVQLGQTGGGRKMAVAVPGDTAAPTAAWLGLKFCVALQGMFPSQN